ncbi:MAG: peptidoglycan DD-metalloendopeptidase family protein [Marmoricola sp.]
MGLPQNTRRHVSWTLALLGTIAFASGPATLSAQADDLHHKKNKVHQGVKAAGEALEESSKSAYAATHRLQAAQSKLAVAQRNLASTQGQLTAAQVIDQQMQAKLAVAQQRLDQAKADLAAGTAAVLQQRRDIGQAAAEAYQYGDPRLIGLSAMLSEGSDPADLSTQLNVVDNMIYDQTQLLGRLKAAEAKLAAQKQSVADAEASVADQRQEAAVNLARKKVLEQRAATARSQVLALVSTRAQALRQARAARASDLHKLHKLKAEEARIKRLILARARKHHGRGFSGSTGGFLLPPVANSYITSPYGWRIHPIYGYWGLHDGDDFHAPCGVPERASASGTVIDQYYSDVWGNRLFLDVGKVNGKAMTLIYNHISAYRSHTGEHVRRGQTIALAGTTGWSTACHLHFTVMLNGTAVDPQKYM